MDAGAPFPLAFGDRGERPKVGGFFFGLGYVEGLDSNHSIMRAADALFASSPVVPVVEAELGIAFRAWLAG